MRKNFIDNELSCNFFYTPIESVFIVTGQFPRPLCDDLHLHCCRILPNPQGVLLISGSCKMFFKNFPKKIQQARKSALRGTQIT